MHDACGTSDTACKQNISIALRKVKNHMRNAIAMQKMENARGVNETACKI
jgi:hypothetical protein